MEEEDCLLPKQSLCWHLLTCLLYAGCNSVTLTGTKCLTRKDRELEGRKRGKGDKDLFIRLCPLGKRL